MMASRQNDEHLGDGVYLSDDRHQLWIAVNDHRNRVVALEQAVFLALVERGAARFGLQVSVTEAPKDQSTDNLG